MSLYIDTSALMKWYIAESDSEAFDAFVEQQSSALISRLTVVEMRSALARRRRNRDITSRTEAAALALFDQHVRDGTLTVLAMQDAHFTSARAIMDGLPRAGLRTLDALHLAVAQANGVREIATADQVMATAARALRFETHLFH